MSVVEGVDTALSTNMLISYATETLHPSAGLEMGHNAATTKTHTAHALQHTNTHTCEYIPIFACVAACSRRAQTQPLE